MKFVPDQENSDQRQLKALLRLAWRLDMRNTKLGFGLSQKGKKPLLAFFIAILFYLFFGIVFADTCANIRDTFVAATFISAAIMLLMAGIMLVEYNTIIISPEDYNILGYMPVSSSTYFVAKLINLLFYTLSFTLILGGPSAVVLSVRDGFTVAKLALSLLAIIASGIFITLFIASIYTFLLRIITPTRLKRFLSYLQFFFALFIYLGYLIIPRLLLKHAENMHIDHSNWLLLLPTSWFAAFIQIGHGHLTFFEFSASITGVVALGILYYIAISRLSLDYAEKMASFSNAPDSAKPTQIRTINARPLPFLSFFNTETRVIARLLRGQFRYDMKFRFSILGMLPIMFVYFYLGLEQGILSDPFLTGSAGIQNFLVFFFAVLFMPLIMKSNIEMSSAFEASWIFYTTPVDLAKLVFAARNLLFVLFSLPTLLFLFFLFVYYFSNWTHAFLHVFTLTLLSFLILQINYFINPKLPFSEPKIRGSQPKLITFFFIALPLMGLLILQFVTANFYYNLQDLVLFYAGLAFVIVIFERPVRKRILKRAHRMAFAGDKTLPK
ncbi:MAG: hypothetical protein H6696_20910 [Deferribacteres bacterium]|nr:hypothetical protein [candidate division KSB1 bacterium]MCB9504394.1 hypothetical protein [Deferribacteres bacterium]